MLMEFYFYSQVHLVVYTLRIFPKTSLYCIGQHLQPDRRFISYLLCFWSVFLYRVLHLLQFFGP